LFDGIFRWIKKSAWNRSEKNKVITNFEKIAISKYPEPAFKSKAKRDKLSLDLI